VPRTSIATTMAVPLPKAEGMKTPEQRAAREEARLMSHEQSFSLLWIDPIASITFFAGDQQAAVKALRAQLELVVGANRWLGARLRVSTDGVPRLAIRIPHEVDVDSVFLDAGDLGIKPDMPYGDVLSAWRGVRLSWAWYAAITSAPLFRVGVTSAGPGQFALVMELNHIVGDGDIFYKIYGMLQPGAEVVALNPDRKLDFSNLANSFQGGFDSTFTPSIKRAIKPLLGSLRVFCRRAPVQPRLLSVDAEWVAQQKAGLSVCSSNDILTSALLVSSGARYGVMPVNMRCRVPGVEKNDAGNYWRPQEILANEFHSPLGVRQVVMASLAGAPISAESARRPSFTQASRVGVVTNWTAFYQDLDFPGCAQIVHMPLMYSKQVAQSYFVVFRPGKDRVAVWCSVRDAEVMKHLEGLPMFSGSVGPTP